MSRADYYREQARLLAKWANESRDPVTAQQLMNRVRHMLKLSEKKSAQDKTEPEPLDP
jgi:hypothetical protein